MAEHIENPYEIALRGDFAEITAFLEANGMRRVFNNGNRHVDYNVPLNGDFVKAELNKTDEGYSLSFDSDKMYVPCPIAGSAPSIVKDYVSRLAEDLRKQGFATTSLTI